LSTPWRAGSPGSAAVSGLTSLRSTGPPPG
jgi:hypothetical protein